MFKLRFQVSIQPPCYLLGESVWDLHYTCKNTLAFNCQTVVHIFNLWTMGLISK